MKVYTHFFILGENEHFKICSIVLFLYIKHHYADFLFVLIVVLGLNLVPSGCTLSCALHRDRVLISHPRWTQTWDPPHSASHPGITGMGHHTQLCRTFQNPTTQWYSLYSSGTQSSNVGKGQSRKNRDIFHRRADTGRPLRIPQLCWD